MVTTCLSCTHPFQCDRYNVSMSYMHSNFVRYEYVNMNCDWIGGRHTNGTLFESPTKFPAGIPALAEYLHDRGLG